MARVVSTNAFSRGRAVQINAKLFRERMRFEARVNIVDDMGTSVGHFEPRFERFCQLQLLRGTENVISARLGGVQPALIFVRYDSETIQINADWRAVDVRSGKEYAIRNIEDMERQKHFLTLIVESGVAA